ncbi:Flp pilus assembly protein TadB [Brevundimonas diminuta]|uniref:Type II secretion system F family protein n=2 Tax=Brevundimonas diminuta TaxID=293 RepID=A0A246KJ24_BREDI|nr:MULTISPECIES: type II secretion system F family protein [Brevundimonas]EGF95857.1 bacterial type II secretion system protein F domain protein [Brevundimonas diminuta ATCC 11568]MBD3571743.1 type II secretion system F family protein [Brevundimonas diminuta]OWR22995.1 type II secretion system protein [Brevundimonas diminuta]QAT13385.1 type II secretion system F family protein [Brevundimonas diminuta]WQE45309.1 type II secretion system F family protein [Brevundimonas diminuta]
MNGFMRFITDPQNLLSIGVGVAVFASVLTLLSSFVGGGARLDKRMKAVAERREELRRRSRQAMRGGAGNEASSLRRTDDSFRSRVVARLNLMKLLEDPKVADNMIQAGFRGPGPLNTFYFFRFATPFILMALTAFYLFVVVKPDLPMMTQVAMVVMAAGVGFYAPNIYLKNMIDKRRASIMAAFPDSLDLLLICVESGMSIEAAIQKVSQEVGGQSIELAEELSLLSAELSYLPDRRMAYEGMAKRTQHPGIKAVATAMTQAETYGTPLGSALRVMAKENRELRLSAAEKKAAALPAKLTVPMILFFLPVLFVVILGPAIINIQDMMKGG